MDDDQLYMYPNLMLQSGITTTSKQITADNFEMAEVS